MTEHTPTPWHADDTAIFGLDGVITRIPNHPENGKNWSADAAFIVKAVNNHDALVKHLHHLATVCCDEDALRLLDSLNDPVGGALRQGERS